MKGLQKIKEKAAGQSGESLIESLVGVLVASLAMAGLAGMVASSTKLLRESKLRMAAYYGANSIVAEQTEGGEAARGSYGFSELLGNGSRQTIGLTDENAARQNVLYFVNDAAGTPVVSFRK